MKLAKSIFISALAVACFGLSIPAADADDTGMAGIHDMMKVGRKTCFSDHSHVGSASGQRSQKAALNAAIDDWQGFTAFEYGTDWAYMKNATKKTKTCERSGSGWSCTVEATPCKRR